MLRMPLLIYGAAVAVVLLLGYALFNRSRVILRALRFGSIGGYGYRGKTVYRSMAPVRFWLTVAGNALLVLCLIIPLVGGFVSAFISN